MTDDDADGRCGDGAGRQYTTGLPAALRDAARKNDLLRQLDFLTPDELLRTEPDGIEHVVGNLLIAGGMSLLSGDPFAGKSTLARHLAVQVAQGESFIGMTTEQGPVLYLAMQDSRFQLKTLFAALGMTARDPVYVAPVWRVPADSLDRLRRIVDAVRPRLVIVDTLGSFAARVADWNEYGAVNKALALFLELARETQTHLMFLHHTGKAQSEDMGRRVLGSQSIQGTVDTLVELRRRPDGIRTIASRQRYGDELAETPLGFDPRTGRFSVGEGRTDRPDDLKDAVMKLFRSPETELKQTDIEQGVTGARERIRRALRELADEGRLACQKGPRNATLWRRAG